jgi:hypothetical protein
VRNDVAQQVGARETHRRPLKISFVFPKRLFQHYPPRTAIRKREVTARTGHGTKAIRMGYASRSVLFVQSGNGLALNRATPSFEDFEQGRIAITPETDIESSPT